MIYVQLSKTNRSNNAGISAEINRVRNALGKTDSEKLKRDYRRHLKRLKAEAKEYCRLTSQSYSKLERKFNAESQVQQTG